MLCTIEVSDGNANIWIITLWLLSISQVQQDPCKQQGPK